LQFDTIEDCLQELGRLEQAERQGNLKTLGNWTAGQNLSHVAAWIEYGWEGYPMDEPPPEVGVAMRAMLGSILENGMDAGMMLPEVEGGTFGAEEMAGEVATHDSPAFGEMSHEQRVKLNLRHAELHLGFLDVPA